MLTLLREIGERIDGSVSTDEHKLNLPPEIEHDMQELVEELRRDVFDPFFKVGNIDVLDENWDEWVKWFSPLMQRFVEKLLPLFADERSRQQFQEIQSEPFVKLTDYIKSHSQSLEETFAIAFKTGMISDIILFSRLNSILSLDLDAQVKELFDKRYKQSTSFGLAFILIIGAAIRTDVSRAKIRFLVLKMKRAAANLHVYTSSIMTFDLGLSTFDLEL